VSAQILSEGGEPTGGTLIMLLDDATYYDPILAGSPGEWIVVPHPEDQRIPARCPNLPRDLGIDCFASDVDQIIAKLPGEAL
jgi:hypothetical protein